MYTFWLTLLFAAVSVRGECPQSIPAMLWSSSKSGNAPDLLQSDSKLVTVLRDSQFVIVFYHPILNVEQFSKRADVYNLHSDAATNQFSSLVNVVRNYGMYAADTINSGERLVALVEGEARGANKRVSKVNLADFRAASFSNDVDYVFVALPDFDDQVAFSAHDFGEFVRELSAYLKSAGAGHTMIYTGLRSGDYCAAGSALQYENDGEELRRRKRQLSTPATVPANNSYTYINVDDCLLFFSTSMQLTFTTSVGNVAFTLPPIYSPGNGTQPLYNVAASYCSNSTNITTASLAFNYTNVVSTTFNSTALAYLSTSWEFSQAGTVTYGNWYLTLMSLSFLITSTAANATGLPSSLIDVPVDNFTITPTDTLTSAAIYAPLTDSFHCTSLNLAPSGTSLEFLSNMTSSVSVAFQLSAFQVQPFIQTTNGIQFGPWNDCDMFFTIPILMSFFTMVLMLFILLFAFCVFSTITTYDRFDDKNSVISLGIQDT